MFAKHIDRSIAPLIISIIIACAVAAQTPPAQSPTAPPKVAQVDQVVTTPEGITRINQLVRSYGGSAPLAQMKSVRIHSHSATSRPVAANPATTEPAPVAKSETMMTIVFPDRMRQDIYTVMNGVTKHRVYVVTPEKEWQQFDDQPADVHPFTHADAMRTIAGNLLYVLQQADSKDYKFAGAGVQKVGQRDQLALDISGPNNVRMRWLINPATGRILRRFDLVPNPEGGIDESATEFYDWESSVNIVVPKRWRTITRGLITDVICNYVVNPEIPPDAFEPTKPATQPTAPSPAPPAGKARK